MYKFNINLSCILIYAKSSNPKITSLKKKKSILISEKESVPALFKLGNASSLCCLPGLEKSFRSVSWNWKSGMMDFVVTNFQPSVWLPWPITSFYSLGSYSLCPPIQTLLHKIPKEEAVSHSLLKHKDWQEKEALRHSYWLLQSCLIW